MSNGVDRDNLAILLEKFRKAASTTTSDRAAKDQLLDELQDAVGLSGKMATEKDIVRRAEQLLQTRGLSLRPNGRPRISGRPRAARVNFSNLPQPSWRNGRRYGLKIR
jgi:hypothetical protein